MYCRNNPLAWALAGAIAAGGALAAMPEAPLIAAFSAARPGEALPAGWVRTAIKGVDNRTTYLLVEEQGATVLRADAQASASAVVHKLSTPASGNLRLQWRWKASGALKTGDPATKEGDDYPARVYVMFDYPLEKLSLGERLRLRLARAFYDDGVPAAALCYVWDTRLRAGTVIASPYTARVRLIVADSGMHPGRWQAVERDLAADFRRAFGEEPPAVSAVAVATDTDNTGEKVTAWYGDIVLKKLGVAALTE